MPSPLGREQKAARVSGVGGPVPTPGSRPIPTSSEDISEGTGATPGPEAGAGRPRTAQATTQEPAPAAAPPEPFDNSKYRNLQHHEYTPYTFLDVNTQLAGQRLPQPSSGRESPRH